MASITNYKQTGKAKLFIPVFFILFPLLLSCIYFMLHSEATLNFAPFLFTVRALPDQDYQATQAQNGLAASDTLKTFKVQVLYPPDLLITDVVILRMDELTLIK